MQPCKKHVPLCKVNKPQTLCIITLGPGDGEKFSPRCNNNRVCWGTHIHAHRCNTHTLQIFETCWPWLSYTIAEMHMAVKHDFQKITFRVWSGIDCILSILFLYTAPACNNALSGWALRTYESHFSFYNCNVVWVSLLHVSASPSMSVESHQQLLNPKSSFTNIHSLTHKQLISWILHCSWRLCICLCLSVCVCACVRSYRWL